MKHSYHLDSIRGLLSLAVVMQHTSAAFIYSITGIKSPLNTYLGLAAHYSVLCFFALSGYVITLSITSNINRNGSFSVSDYVLSRVIRILPPLLGAILLTFVLSLILIHFNSLHSIGDFQYSIRSFYSPDIIGQLKSIFTLTISGNLPGGDNNVNGALWSLAYEIQFYVFAGLIAIIFSAKKTPLKIISILLMALYWRELKINVDLTIQIVAFFCFASGSAAYFLKEFLFRKWMIFPALATIAIVIIGTLCDWKDVIPQLRENIDNDGVWMTYQIVLGMLFSVFIVFAESFAKTIDIFHGISKFSYSLYIIHFPVIVFLWFMISNHAPNLLNHYYILSIVIILATLVLAKWFAAIFEQPKRHKELLCLLRIQKRN